MNQVESRGGNVRAGEKPMGVRLWWARRYSNIEGTLESSVLIAWPAKGRNNTEEAAFGNKGSDNMCQPQGYK